MSAGLIVDLFAGGGGASTGIEMALGRSPDLAVNHDPEALALHAANHPHTRHLVGDVWDVSPRKATGGQPVELLWASPDCTFFSRARGGKPFRDPKSATGRRGLAWVVTRWARDVRPRIIGLENVPEIEDWCPLGEDGLPDWSRRGLTFRRWVGTLKAAGYQVEWRVLRACDYGAPTTRTRFFLIARCDGQPIVWPTPTHGPGRIPYRTAAECIDWSLPCRSIFGRPKPLAEATLRRVARGIQRFVLDAVKPFVVGDVAPTLIQTGYGERQGQAPRVLDLHAPLGTIVAGGQKHGLVCAWLAKHYGGHEATGSSLADPVHTITTSGQMSLLSLPMARAVDHAPHVRAFLTRYNGTGDGQALQLPLGTITTKDRFGLVMVAGEAYGIADIGLRMLSPRELYTAQGFPRTYAIDVDYEGGRLTQTAQIRMCGNSAPPEPVAAIIGANVTGAQQEAA